MKLSSRSEGRVVAKELATAMNKRLNYADQFNTFVYDVEIAAGSEVAIPNKLTNKNGKKIIPKSWQVIDSKGTGKEGLGRGSTEWTLEQLYVKNYSLYNGNFSIRFFEQAPDEESTLSVPTAGGLTLATSYTVSAIHLDSPNGHGSTNNKIRRYTNTRVNTGSDMTYADSAANGMSVTINTAGVYGFYVCDYYTAGDAILGLSVNSSALTTTIESVTYANGKRAVNQQTANRYCIVSIQLPLVANDVVRVHTNGLLDNTAHNGIFSATLLWK